MGQCYYKGQPIAGNKQTCNPSVHPGVSWVEDDTAPATEGSFLDAVSSLWDEDKPEKFTEYVERRYEEDPYKLAFDAATWAVPGGFALKGIMGAGKMANIFKKTFRKPTKAVPGTPASSTFSGTGTFTKPTGPAINPKTGLPMPAQTKVPSYPINAPNAGRTIVTPKQGTFAKPLSNPINRTAAIPGIPASTVFSPGRLALTGTALGAGAYGVDRNLYPMTAQAKQLEQERATASMQPSIDIIDAKEVADQQEKVTKELALKKQNEIDNMSFFDKFKLGMKDPSTAALFGAGLRDIGGNKPGGNQLGEMQMGLAKAAASASGPSASLFNATKLSEATLMDRFTKKKPFFSMLGDSEKEREKQATYMVGLYRSLQSELLNQNLPADDRTVMALLEEKFGKKA